MTDTTVKYNLNKNVLIIGTVLWFDRIFHANDLYDILFFLLSSLLGGIKTEEDELPLLTAWL